MIWAGLSGCTVSLAADVTPPPNAQSFVAQPASATSEVLYPTVPPDPQRGAQIYAEKCVACHGERGMGDGPQASQLTVPVPPLGDLSLAQGARPVEWFQIVTNGNIERFMPPFRSLDERQRWDVVAYALSLSLSQDLLAQGAEIYQQKCQNCHGTEGQGSAQAPGWRDDTSRLASLSLVEMTSIIRLGKGNMPAYAGELTESQILALAAYSRSLSFETSALVQSPTLSQIAPGTAEQAEGEQVQAASELRLPIRGEVVNGSGGQLPPGLTAELAGYDGMVQVFAAETEVAADGTYTFPDVEIVPGRAFIVSVNYQGFTFNSDVFHNLGEPVSSPIELPVTVYDTTTDLSALRVDRLHVFFDFTNPDVIQVAELFLLNNTGSKVISGNAPGQPVVEFELPAGASNLQFQSGAAGGRFVMTEKGFADTQPILPGAGSQILFAYDLPLSRRTTVRIPINLPVDAAIVMIPQGTMTLQSSQLQPMGQRQIQGVTLDLFSTTDLQAGSTLEMTLSGRMSSPINLQTGQTGALIAGALALVLVAVGGVFWYLRQQKSTTPVDEQPPVETESREALMDAIIALDDLYKSGQLSEEVYQQRRAELKDRLRALMD
jgi:mono/diheme cytochrome c family protein